MPFGHGDDDARVRERRGTTPLTYARTRTSLMQAVTGLYPSGSTKPLPEQEVRSSGDSPVIAGSAPMQRILAASVPKPEYAALAAHRGSPRRSPTMGGWLEPAFRQR